MALVGQSGGIGYQVLNSYYVLGSVLGILPTFPDLTLETTHDVDTVPILQMEETRLARASDLAVRGRAEICAPSSWVQVSACAPPLPTNGVWREVGGEGQGGPVSQKAQMGVASEES